MQKQTIAPFIMLSNSDCCFRVLLEDIVYCKSYNSSTEFHLKNKKNMVASCSMQYYEKALAPFGFIRIHQQTLINIACLCHLGKGEHNNTVLLTTGESLVIARQKKNQVTAAILRWSILPNNSKKQPTEPQILPNSQMPKRRKGK